MSLPVTLIKTIELAFFDVSRSASEIAAVFSTLKQPVHASDVSRIWAKARATGGLPKIRRQRARRGNRRAA